MFDPGTVLADKFRVERVLGRGGMGTVIAAKHLQLGSTVALKFIKPEVAKKPGLAERFMREARASAQLRGEHVCRVFDVGVIGGAPYLVMELLEGVDLAKQLKMTGEFPVGTACNYLLQACAGVSVAHAAGIIHRDLKPGNLFVTRGFGGMDVIKVLDFGLAKITESEEEEEDLTKVKNLIGSPAYMSPEQIHSGHDVDHRTDIWSLGVVLYELLTGKHPFVGENLHDLIKKIDFQQAPRLPFDNPELDAIIRRCLAKEAGRRYANVGELAKVLAPLGATPVRTLPSQIMHVLETGKVPRLAEGTPTAIEDRPPATHDTHPDRTEVLSDPDQASVATTLQAASGMVTPQRMPRRRSWLVAPAVVAVAVVGLVIYRTRPDEVATAIPTPRQAPAPPPDAMEPSIVIDAADQPALAPPPDAAPAPVKKKKRRPPEDPFGAKRI